MFLPLRRANFGFNRSPVLKVTYPRSRSKFQLCLVKLYAELRLTVSSITRAWLQSRESPRKSRPRSPLNQSWRIVVAHESREMNFFANVTARQSVRCIFAFHLPLSRFACPSFCFCFLFFSKYSWPKQKDASELKNCCYSKRRMTKVYIRDSRETGARGCFRMELPAVSIENSNGEVLFFCDLNTVFQSEILRRTDAIASFSEM